MIILSVLSGVAFTCGLQELGLDPEATVFCCDKCQYLLEPINSHLLEEKSEGMVRQVRSRMCSGTHGFIV